MSNTENQAHQTPVTQDNHMRHDMTTHLREDIALPI